MTRNWTWWLTALAMCVLIVFMIVPEDFDYTTLGTAMPQAGSTTSRAVWLALLCTSGLVVLGHLRAARLIVSQMNPFFLALCVLAGASVLWSIDHGFTVRRLIRLATIFFVVLAFVLVSGRRVQEVLRPAITAVLAASIIMVMFYPALALERSGAMELAGAWHGLATQKNGLGSLAAIGTILWVHAVVARETRLPMAAVGLAISLVCLFYSRSSTSLLTTLFTVPLMVFLMRPPEGMRHWVPGVASLFFAALLVYTFAVLRLVPGLLILLRPIGALTDKDPTFSGRTEIWDIIREHISYRPFLGSGYGAYWVGPIMGTPSYEHVLRLHFYPTEAHNGYLDVVNDLGLLGGALLLGFLFYYVRQSLQLFPFARAQGALFLGILFEQLLENMSESRWMNVLCVQFVIMTVATLALARAQLDHRLQEYYRKHEHRAGVVRRGPTSARA